MGAMEAMDKAMESLNGENEFLRTKDDIRANLAKTSTLSLILKALAYGAEVKIGGRFFVMVDGLIYLKGVSFNSSTGEAKSSYLGYSHMPYEALLADFSKAAEDEAWLEKIKVETAMKAALNPL